MTEIQVSDEIEKISLVQKKTECTNCLKFKTCKIEAQAAPIINDFLQLEQTPPFKLVDLAKICDEFIPLQSNDLGIEN